MRYSNVAVSVLAAALAACSAGENPSTTNAAAREAAVRDVGARMDSYVALAKAGDMSALADYFEADAVLWEPEMKATGPDIVKLFEEFQKTMTIGNLEATATERVTYDSATVLYEFGHFAESLLAKDGKSAAQNHKGNYAIRWMRGTDSKWRIHRFLVTDAPADSVQVAPAGGAVAPADGPAVDAAAVTTQVMQAMTAAVAKTNAGDETGLLNAWAEDIQLYEPGVQFMSKTAVAPGIHALMSANNVNIALVNDKVFAHDNGHVAYLLGEYQETLTPKDGKSKPMQFHNKFMARWKRAADGGWLWDRMIVVPLPKDSAK